MDINVNINVINDQFRLLTPAVRPGSDGPCITSDNTRKGIPGLQPVWNQAASEPDFERWDETVNNVQY